MENNGNIIGNHRFQAELQEIQRIRELVDETDHKLLPGRLHVGMAQGKYPQYFFLEEGAEKEFPRGKYMPAGKMDVVTEYAQEEYRQRMEKKIDKLEKQINKIVSLEGYDFYGEVSEIYEKMPEAKRKLVTPFVLSSEAFADKWMQSFVTGENTYPIENGFTTERGELVRSKTEKMIADKLFLKKIPYVYEAKLKLKKNHVIYPDFTMLNVRTREVFYLEHFGMMDNPEYCKKALEKMDLYDENQIYVGKNLLPTFESNLKPVNMKQIDLYIKRFLI